MMNKYKVIALFGYSCSGKDTIQNKMVSLPNTHKIISCTTREKRDYEKEGVDYFFITHEQFAQKVMCGDILEATIFQNNAYGTPIAGLHDKKINIGIFDSVGVESLIADQRIEVVPVFVIADDKVRLLRALQREENPNCEKICTRFLDEKKLFQDLDFDYSIIHNNYNGIDNVDGMVQYIVENFDGIYNFKDIHIYRDFGQL